MDKLTKPFDRYVIDYATTNALGKEFDPDREQGSEGGICNAD